MVLNAWFGIGASLLFSALHSIYYIFLFKAAQQVMVAELAETAAERMHHHDANNKYPNNINNPSDELLLQRLSLGVLGVIPGVALGFLLTWPVANAIGRRNGLLWSNLFVPLGVVCQWASQLGALPLLSFPSGMCFGVQPTLQNGLYSLYIFEASPRAWRPFALVSVWLASSFALSAGSLLGSDPIPSDYLRADDIGLAWLVSLSLIPSGMQTGALLLCSVESPGYTATQDRNPAQAQADAKRLFLSASDLEEDVRREADGRLGCPLRCVAILTTGVSLAFVPFLAQFHSDNFLASILDLSPTFAESGALIKLYLTLGFALVAWGTMLWLGPRCSGKALFFSFMGGLILSAFARVLLVLIPHLLARAYKYDFSSMETLWAGVAWWVFIIDGLSLPLTGFLFNSLLILLMEMAPGTRSRAGMIILPFLVSGVVLAPLVGLIYRLLREEEVPEQGANWAAYDGTAAGGPGLVTRWTARLILNVVLVLLVRVLWKIMGDFGVGGQEEAGGVPV